MTIIDTNYSGRMTLGLRLKYARKSVGLSQAEITFPQNT